MKKFGNPKLVVTTAVLTVLLAGLIGYSEMNQSHGPVSGGAGLILNPAQRIGYAVNGRVEQLIDFYFNFEEVRQVNEALKKQLAEQTDKIRQFDEIQKENIDLRAMFQYKDRHSEYEYIGTNVINRSLSPLSPSYTLDKGSTDGIRRGMVVITYEGLAGQITEVFDHHSILETISSENIKVSVVSAGTREFEGMLSGTTILGRSNMAVITEMSLEADIAPGDDIITSGIGGFYPPDIYVGKIESMAEDRGKLMKTAVVKPVVLFNGTERFYIVLPKNMEELTYLC